MRVASSEYKAFAAGGLVEETASEIEWTGQTRQGVARRTIVKRVKRLMTAFGQPWVHPINR